MLGGTWFWFIRNVKNEESNVFLIVLMIVSPFLLFVGGIAYGSITHSQGAALSAAALAILLIINSLVIITVISFRAIRIKRSNTSSL